MPPSGSVSFTIFDENQIIINMVNVPLNQHEGNQGLKRVFRASDRADKPTKSIIKAVSWHIADTIGTILIRYFITGRVTIAISKEVSGF